MPTATAYDPFSADVLADPYPFYRALRDDSPCHFVEERGIWVISRYDDVVGVLRDHARFSSTEGVGYDRRPVPMMIAYDPPEHTRLRRLVAKQFTPREIAKLEPRIRQIVDDLIDPMLEGGTVDLTAALAMPLPTTVIAELLGVPPADRHDFKRWSDDTIDALGGEPDPERRAVVEAGIVEFVQYFHGVIEERQARADAGEAGDDLISVLLGPTPTGDRLNPMELVSFCVLLLVAGNETTTNLIGNGAAALLEHPDQWAVVEDDRGKVPALVEEALRYDAPIQGFFRTPNDDVEMHGVTIPARGKTMVLYGSANRDERRYDDPDAFVVARNPVDQVAFGSGIHTCLGAALARLEGRVVVEAFLDRVRSVHLAGDVERTTNPLLRGVRRLPVGIDPR